MKGKRGTATVKHVRMQDDEVIHECTIEGSINDGEAVECTIDWNLRYHNMRVHSAGHVVHEAVRLVAPYLDPIKGEHGKSAYIEYRGLASYRQKPLIEEQANALVRQICHSPLSLSQSTNSKRERPMYRNISPNKSLCVSSRSVNTRPFPMGDPSQNNRGNRRNIHFFRRKYR